MNIIMLFAVAFLGFFFIGEISKSRHQKQRR